MAIRGFGAKGLAREVIRRIRNTSNRRLKQVMTSFIRRMDDFVLMPPATGNPARLRSPHGCRHAPDRHSRD